MGKVHVPSDTSKGNTVHQCSKCHKYKNRSHLSRHRQICLGIKKFSCESCSSDFSRKENLVLHMKKCKGKRLTKCLECDINFKTTWRLKRHLQQGHTAKKTFKCSKCSRTFKRETFFKKHEETCNGPSGDGEEDDDFIPSMADVFIQHQVSHSDMNIGLYQETSILNMSTDFNMTQIEPSVLSSNHAPLEIHSITQSTVESAESDVSGLASMTTPTKRFLPVVSILC